MTARRDGIDFDRVQAWALAHVEQLAEEYGGVTLRRGRCRCPVHGGDNPDAFSVANGKGWHCFTGDCGKGDGVALVALLTGRERVDVLRELAPRAGVFLDVRPAGGTRYHKPPARPRPIPREAPAPPPPWWAADLDAVRAGGMIPASSAEVHTLLFAALTLGPAGRAYLTERGFPARAAEAYGFRSVEHPDEWRRVEAVLAENFLPAERAQAALDHLPTRYAPALLIPYRSPDGAAVVGVNCRALCATLEPRYRKPKGASLSVPFNAPALEGLTGADTVHIVEGELNAYTLHGYGARAVSLGSATSPAAVVEALARAVITAGRVVLWFDDDTAGAKGFRAACDGLAPHIRAAAAPPVVVRQRITKAHDGDAKDINDLHRAGALAAVIEEAAWQK